MNNEKNVTHFLVVWPVGLEIYSFYFSIFIFASINEYVFTIACFRFVQIL